MAYAFFDRLFNDDASVRLRAMSNGVYRLEELSTEPLSARSYVDLHLPNGFVIKHDENFRVKNLFKNTKGFVSKSDFIVVSGSDSELEYYVVELKSRNYKIAKVQRQFRSGISLAAYCRRLGTDAELDASRFAKFSVYAVVLTNTVSEHRGTAIDRENKNLEFAKSCECSKGVYCVNGHSVTLDGLRKYAFKVGLDVSDVNDFKGMLPYPGGPDAPAVAQGSGRQEEN